MAFFAVREALAADRRIGIIAPMPCSLSDERIVWRRIASDAAGFARIVVKKPPLSESWRAVNDRLQRAVAGSGAA